MIRSLISLLAIGAAVALFFLYTKPAYDGVESLRAENDSYDLALDKAAELQRLKQSLLSRYNSFNPADVERLNKLLPDHVDNVRLVLDLDTLAANHGLALQNVIISRAAPERERNGETIGPQLNTYESLTFGFSTTGTYANFRDFIMSLEESLRVVDIIDLSISGGGGAVAGGEPVYSFDVTLRTYWLQ